MLAGACHTKNGPWCERFISKPVSPIAYMSGCPCVNVSRRANAQTFEGFLNPVIWRRLVSHRALLNERWYRQDHVGAKSR